MKPKILDPEEVDNIWLGWILNGEKEIEDEEE
jgi:hypothetical protein